MDIKGPDIKPDVVKVIRKGTPGGHIIINRSDMKPGDKLFIDTPNTPLKAPLEKPPTKKKK